MTRPDKPTTADRPGTGQVDRPGPGQPAADLRCKAQHGKQRCELSVHHGNVHRITWTD